MAQIVLLKHFNLLKWINCAGGEGHGQQYCNSQASNFSGNSTNMSRLQILHGASISFSGGTGTGA
jgi:hypothetical protein